MAFTFIIEFEGDATELFDSVHDALTKAGGVMTGNIAGGIFNGKGVEATYSVAGQIITIEIHKKPWYATMGMVESRIRILFESFTFKLVPGRTCFLVRFLNELFFRKK